MKLEKPIAHFRAKGNKQVWENYRLMLLGATCGQVFEPFFVLILFNIQLFCRQRSNTMQQNSRKHILFQSVFSYFLPAF